MNIRNRVRFLSIMSVIILAAGAAGATFSVRRVNSLRELQIATQATLGSTFRLLSETSTLSSTAGLLHRHVNAWQDTVELTAEGIEFVTTHPALDILDVGDAIGNVQRGWRFSYEIFTDTREPLQTLLSRDVPGIDLPTGLDHLEAHLTALTVTDEEGDPVTPRPRSELIAALAREDFAPETYDEALQFVRGLQLRMSSGSTNLSYFVTGSLQELADTIESEAELVVRQTIVVTSLAVTLLVLAAVAGLITGTRFLESANRNLESRVRERTRSIQSLLDFSRQGFLSFGPDFLVRPEYSRECEMIFGRSILAEDIGRLLYGDSSSRDDFVDALTLVFEGRSNAEVVFDLLDSEVWIGDKVVELEYRKIDDQRIMCSLRDTTEQRELRSKVEAENALREMLLTIVTNHADFSNLLREADDLFVLLDHFFGEEEKKGSDAVLHALHTFKANAGFLRLDDISEAAHELEQKISEGALFADYSAAGEAFSSLREALKRELLLVEEHLGTSWVTREESVVVPRGELENLERRLREIHGEDHALTEHLRMLRMVSFRSLEPRFFEMAAGLAASRGKRLLPVEFEGDEITLDAEVSEVVSSALTHLVRNMIDHGIERPREREVAGKPPEGRVRIVAENRGDTAAIVVEDDGRGIDVDAVRRRGVQRNLIDPEEKLSREDVVKLIFRDGFSTASVVSATSGHGIGLPAVRNAVKRIHGKLTVTTRPGKGTRFVISIPTISDSRMAG